MGNVTDRDGFFRQASPICRGMAEKDPPFGHIGIFSNKT